MDRQDYIANAVRAQVSLAFPKANVRKITRLASAEPHPVHRVDLSDGTALMLSGPALPVVSGMAISSYSTTQTEAIVLGWLEYRRHRPSRLDALSASISESGSSSSLRSMADDTLDIFLPRLVRYFELDTGQIFFGDKGVQQRRSAYNLTIPVSGTPITSLDPPPSGEERRSIDHQSGRLLKMLSNINSPNGRFGFAAEVLAAQPFLPNEYAGNIGPQPSKRHGDRTWSDAYERLLLEAREEASRKKLSSIAFGRLHKQFERHRSILDHVMRPRLVALSGGDDYTTLVDRAGMAGGEPKESWGTWPDEADGSRSIRVTGFRHWSNLLFGDPLIAKSLCMNPSRDIVNGFTGDHGIAYFSSDLPSGLIDDRRHVHIRLMLYQCYWTIKDIIRRPTLPSIEGIQAAMPSPAWMELHDILERLEEIPSSTSNLARESRRWRVRKRRRSESPIADGLRTRESATEWFFPAGHRRRRCTTP